jgi:shikimate dehydrogenase
VPQHTREEHSITGASNVYGIIGDPVEHSLSPSIWNSAFKEVYPDGVYVPFKVNTENLASAIRGLQALNVIGINITRPHKSDAAKLCSKLNPPASSLKAVNTIRFSPNEIEGWNTDATGFKNILQNLELPDTALILGSGSSSRSIIWALEQSGIKNFFQISRKESLRPDFLDNTSKFQNFSWNADNLNKLISACKLVINTTPLGWNSEDKLDELAQNLTSEKIYIDLNYAENSQLLAAAKKARCTVINGKELLLAQAYDSFRLLTGLEPPQKIMRSCIF